MLYDTIDQAKAKLAETPKNKYGKKYSIIECYNLFGKTKILLGYLVATKEMNKKFRYGKIA